MSNKVRCPHCHSMSGVCTNRVKNGIMETIAVASPVVEKFAINIVKGFFGMQPDTKVTPIAMNSAKIKATKRADKWAGENKFECKKCGYTWVEKNEHQY